MPERNLFTTEPLFAIDSASNIVVVGALLDYDHEEELWTEMGSSVPENEDQVFQHDKVNVCHDVLWAGQVSWSVPGDIQNMEPTQTAAPSSGLSYTPSSTEQAEAYVEKRLTPASAKEPQQQKHNFTKAELKIRPKLVKSKKQFVPAEGKTEKYREMRHKNTAAAKRSRDAGRLRDKQLEERVIYLENKNQGLKEELELVEKQIKSLLNG